MEITYLYLADCPELIPTLVAWFDEEWGHLAPTISVERREARLHENLNRDSLPLTLVAFLGEEPVGTASLLVRQMRSRRHLPHWLGAVYVRPGHRNRGIGSRLVERAIAEAERLGVRELYLHTPDHEGMYARLGWRLVERIRYRDQDEAVMWREVGA